MQIVGPFINNNFNGGRSMLRRPVTTFLADGLNNVPIGISLDHRRYFLTAHAHRTFAVSKRVNIGHSKALGNCDLSILSGANTCTSRKRSVTSTKKGGITCLCPHYTCTCDSGAYCAGLPSTNTVHNCNTPRIMFTIRSVLSSTTATLNVSPIRVHLHGTTHRKSTGPLANGHVCDTKLPRYLRGNQGVFR